MKKYIFGFALLVMFISAAVAQAVVLNTSSTTVRQQIKDSRQEIVNTRQQGIQETATIRQETRAEIKSLSTSTIVQIKQKRDEMKAQIQTKADELKKLILEKRDDLKAIIAAQRANLVEKLKQIKDENKRKISESIYDKISALNNRLSDHFLAVLNQLEKVLNNIGSRADKAEGAGHDVSVVRTAIADAQKAIDLSREAVKIQAGKTYPIVISSSTLSVSNSSSTLSTKLKVDVGKARQMLHTDLVAVRATVFAARDAVHKAAQALAQIQGVDDIEIDIDGNATSTNATSTDSD